MRWRIEYSLRLLALIGATVSGILLIVQIARILISANRDNQRHFMIFLERSDVTQARLLAIGFIASIILFRMMKSSGPGTQRRWN